MDMIKDQVLKIIQEATGEKKIHLEATENEAFGDYTTNLALKGGNPRQIAEKIVSDLQKNIDSNKLFEKIEVAGPGFINFRLKEEFLVRNLVEILKGQENYGSSDLNKGKKVMFEYGQPKSGGR